MRRAVILTAVAIIAVALTCGLAPAQVNQEMIDRCLAGDVDEARASWWGFDAEDSTAALQAAINSGAKSVLVEDMGSPWIVTPIQLASDQEVIFEEGVEILAKRGEFKGRNDSLFTARDVENVILRGNGATFRMWQEDYDNPELYEKAEWRHCLQLRGATNVEVHDLILRDSGGDGIYLGIGPGGSTNTDIHIKGVDCDSNYRQGISVITAENLLIEDTIMRNTSGTPPQAGIDFEPNNSGERLVNVVMRNCVTENNNSSGYMFYLRPLNSDSIPVSVRIENCRSINDRGHSARVITDGTVESAVGGTIEFVDCVFENPSQPAVSVTKPAGQGLVRFERCTVPELGAIAPIVFLARAEAQDPIGGVEFEDVVVASSPDRAPMSYVDQSGGIPLENITGNLILVGPDGERDDLQLTEEVLAGWMPVVKIAQVPSLDLDTDNLVPLVLDSPAASTDVRWPIIRKAGDLLLYAHEGDEVRFVVNHMQLAKIAGKEMPVKVIAPSGEVAHETIAPFKEETEVGFVAPETGVYSMSLAAGANRFQVRGITNPVVVDASAGPVNFVGQEKDLTFYVPEGTEEFAVHLRGEGTGEAVKATLLTPTGEVFGEVDNQFQLHQFHVELEQPGQGGIWTLQIRKPSDITWEDHFVELRGVPPVLAPAGATLLVPAGE
ncbi:MAG: right-handed parallel beta-helix repeat-containing protein [Armatimonadota bacterium]